MKITTKSGDKGETGLFDGERVKKSSVIMQVLGDLDEFNSVLGWVKCALGGSAKGKKQQSENVESLLLFERMQDDVYKIMSFISCKFKWHPKVPPISEKDIEFLEKEIDKYDEIAGGLNKFIRPGVNEIDARLHIARSVCRRAERSYVKLLGEKAESGEEAMMVLKYLNRLSDLLFMMAYAKS